MDKVIGIDKPPVSWPLMYQGVSDKFYGPTDDVRMVDEALQIDFEGEFGVIVDVEASRAIRQAEVGAAKTMIDRTEDRFGLKPARLAADTAYAATAALLMG